MKNLNRWADMLERGGSSKGSARLTARVLALSLAPVFFSATALAGTSFFITPDSGVAVSSMVATSNTPVQVFTSNPNELIEGMEIDVVLPSGDLVTGSLKREDGIEPQLNLSSQITGNKVAVVPFEDGLGALEVYAQDGVITGVVLFDSESTEYYSASVDSTGNGLLIEESADALHCVLMPVDNTSIAPPTAEDMADVPELEGIFNLESRPGASRVIYIDYDGGVTSGTAWNDRYNGGNDIVYEPFSSDSDTAEYSTIDQYLMYVGWLEMAEDYAPFDVNITTRESVFDATPRTLRSRINATPTRAWVGNFGGIAYVGIFGQDSDRFSTGWTFNATAGSLGQTHSHEAGHQMGLRHHGTSAVTYYRGHGRWGPIMGAPFGRQYVQFSEGNYPDANNSSQNDLNVVAGRLTALADDVGNTTNTAQAIVPPVFGVMGTITPDGLTADDDVYTFTLSADDPNVTIEVATSLGDEEESFGANAALNASLVDSNGVLIASMASGDVTPLSPFTNKLSYSGPLAAETYYLTIEAQSPNTDLGTGFDEYGNGGFYLVTVDAEGSSGPPVITSPVPETQIETLDEVFSWSYSELADTDFWIYLGSSVGGSDIIDSGNLGPQGSFNTVFSGIELPLDGRDIYVRLWYRDSDAEVGVGIPWDFIDAVYTTIDLEGMIKITSPSSDEILPGADVSFDFEDETGSTDFWWLYAGSSEGQRDYFDSGLINANEPEAINAAVLGSLFVEGLPTDSSTVHVRLWNREIGNVWEYNDFTFTAASIQIVSFSSPSVELPLPGPTVTFEFADASGDVGEWWLYLGSAPGQLDYYDSGNLGSVAQTTATTVPVEGQTVFARLWYRIEGQPRWQYIDEMFQASGAN